MPFFAGEHVGVRRNGYNATVYGQVMRRTGNNYLIRLGGANSTFEAREDEMHHIMPDRRVSEASFPAPVYLDSAINLSTLSYPFSNEQGFKQSSFWDALREGGIADGAVIGVSGSVFDIATGDLDACKQIVSVDINRETVEAIDKLRKLLNALRLAGDIINVKKHWKTGLKIESKWTTSQFFTEMIFIFKTQGLTIAEDFMSGVKFPIDGVGVDQASKEEIILDGMAKSKVMRYVLELEPLCSGRLNYSCWFKTDAAIDRLTVLLGEGRVSLLCGDMIRPEMLQALTRVLDYPVAVFNLSNAIDYIDNPDALKAFFAGINAATGAKVVSSSVCPALATIAGTFQEPKVHHWDDFLALLDDVSFRANVGTKKNEIEK